MKALHASHDGRKFKIEEEAGVGFYVYVFEGERCTADYLQDSLALAKEFALHKFGVPQGAWTADRISGDTEK
jgi:hypothetical protein